MGAEALWRDVEGQLFYVVLALAGSSLLPGRSLADRLGLVRARLSAGAFAVAILGFLALSNALHGAVVWLDLLEGTTLARIDDIVRETSPAHPGLVFLAIGVMPALGEELLFRGFVLRLVALRWPGLVAVLASAALFGVAHLDVVHGSAAFALGAYLGAVALRARSLLPTILCHGANNALAVAGVAGLVPEIGRTGAPVQVALAFALALGCLAFVLRGASLQPGAPPADGGGIPRGPDEDHSSGTDRR